MYNKLRSIKNQIAGLCLNDSQKLDLIIEALDLNDIDLIEAALSKGAEPRPLDLKLLLIRADFPPTEKEIIQICEIFRKFGCNLNQTTQSIVDGFGPFPTLISTVIEFSNYSPQLIDYFLSCGVRPTGADILVACRPRNNPEYLKALIDIGIDPYIYVRSPGEFRPICILFETLTNQDLEKIKLVAQYPYRGEMSTDVRQQLQELFAVAEGKVGDSEFSQEFAIVAAQYLGHLKKDASKW